MAIRPEAISLLRPSTYSFMLKILCSGDVGLKSVGKNIGVCGSGITRVSRTTGAKQKRCQVFFLSNFSKDIQSQLIKGILHSCMLYVVFS